MDLKTTLDDSDTLYPGQRLLARRTPPRTQGPWVLGAPGGSAPEGRGLVKEGEERETGTGFRSSSGGVVSSSLVPTTGPESERSPDAVERTRIPVEQTRIPLAQATRGPQGVRDQSPGTRNTGVEDPGGGQWVTVVPSKLGAEDRSTPGPGTGRGVRKKSPSPTLDDRTVTDTRHPRPLRGSEPSVGPGRRKV